MPSFSGIIKLDAGCRLDAYIARNLRLLTRSQIKARKLNALVNGKPVKLSYNVKNGEQLELVWEDAPPLRIIPEDIPLDIIYEDKHIIVVNKRQGMVVHPGAGNHSGTLMNALLFRKSPQTSGAESSKCIDSEYISEFDTSSSRPFIVHRLDKDTSGVIICAYDDVSLRFLSEQFKARTVRKLYYALVSGVPHNSAGIIDTFICRHKYERKKFTAITKTNAGGAQTAAPSRGKRAITRYKVLKTFPADGGKGLSFSLLALIPKTGRTHQIRVHLRHIGHPVLGDPLYAFGNRAANSANKTLPSLMLHAARLRILLPDANEPSTFKAPLPERFKKVLS
ncbi:MAG: RluA family pseudouridine synthase [Spirochaetaceae bacterium]|jgi:23S rRNA pseudouridine1911/1915/1917 synthase|nr:RluA family pseudouridine synthase [Spirochaetaceae bacterium]